LISAVPFSAIRVSSAAKQNCTSLAKSASDGGKTRRGALKPRHPDGSSASLRYAFLIWIGRPIKAPPVPFRATWHNEPGESHRQRFLLTSFQPEFARQSCFVCCGDQLYSRFAYT